MYVCMYIKAKSIRLRKEKASEPGKSQGSYLQISISEMTSTHFSEPSIFFFK